MQTPSQLPPPNFVPVKRALISVSDKTGIVAFATALQKEFGVELVSTGGTAKALRTSGSVVETTGAVAAARLRDGAGTPKSVLRSVSERVIG